MTRALCALMVLAVVLFLGMGAAGATGHRQGVQAESSADAAGPSEGGKTAEEKERLAWESFAKSLDAGKLAKDYPGALRDLDSGDTEKAITALRILGAIGSIEAIPYIVPFLDSPKLCVKAYAGLALKNIVSSVELKRRDMKHPDGIVLRPRRKNDPDLTPLRWIVRKMLTSEDDDGNTPAYGATIAAYIRLKDLEEELRALLKNRHPAVSRSASHALSTLGFTVRPRRTKGTKVPATAP